MHYVLLILAFLCFKISFKEIPSFFENNIEEYHSGKKINYFSDFFWGPVLFVLGIVFTVWAAVLI